MVYNYMLYGCTGAIAAETLYHDQIMASMAVVGCGG